MAYDFKDLTEKQRKFCEEYIIDLNVSAAAGRAGYVTPTSGYGCLALQHCQDYIAHLSEERAKRLHITQDEVLSRLWAIATADVNELVQYRRNCCRHCYGEEHRYQWTDSEFERAQTEAKNRGWPVPEAPGGNGYDQTKPPVDDCPECQGEGDGRVHAQDTRKVSAGAKMLYAGAKVGRDGLEIKIHDQMRALELVGKHVGLFKERVEHSGEIKNTGPVLNLLLTSPDAPKPAAQPESEPPETEV